MSKRSSRARPVRDELGAHVSAAGGVRNAPPRAAALDACVLQLFTKQPNRWAEPALDDDECDAYRTAVRAHGIVVASAHDSYLINLASPDGALHARSLESFRAELQRCTALGIPFVVTHPGNATDGDAASGLVRNAEAVQQVLEGTDGVTVLFETTAGAGTALGASFDGLAALVHAVPAALKHRVGVCFDTCHVWAAGYDLRTRYDEVMARFDDAMGTDRIRMFHLNDSLCGLGSHRDRHAHIGAGALGDQPFQRLLRDERFRAVPKLIETPKDNDALRADRANLRRLRRLRA